MKDAFRTVLLPEDLCAAAEQRFAGQFRNLEDLLLFTLREVISERATDLDRVEQTIIEQRLRELGYL